MSNNRYRELQNHRMVYERHGDFIVACGVIIGGVLAGILAYLSAYNGPAIPLFHKPLFHEIFFSVIGALVFSCFMWIIIFWKKIRQIEENNVQDRNRGMVKVISISLFFTVGLIIFCLLHYFFY